MRHIANYFEFELHLPGEHSEIIASKIGSFLTCLTPCRAKNLMSDPFFNNHETVRRRWVNYTFFLNRMVLDNIETTFEFLASCTGCDPAAI